MRPRPSCRVSAGRLWRLLHVHFRAPGEVLTMLGGPGRVSAGSRLPAVTRLSTTGEYLSNDTRSVRRRQG